MGELFDNAQRQAEAARENASMRAREQEAKKEFERQLSSQRAAEFTELMIQYNVPQVALQEEHWHKPLISRLSGTEPFSYSRRHLRLVTVAMGWVAIDQLYIPEEDYKIFIGEGGEIISCREQKRWNESYLVTDDRHSTFALDTDRILARDDAMRAMSNKLIQLGII